MPTYSVMYAGAGGDGGEDDAEVVHTPLRATPVNGPNRDGSRGGVSSSDSGIGRGKGRGDAGSSSGGTRQRENWCAAEGHGDVKYYQMASEGSSGDQSGTARLGVRFGVVVVGCTLQRELVMES